VNRCACALNSQRSTHTHTAVSFDVYTRTFRCKDRPKNGFTSLSSVSFAVRIFVQKLAYVRRYITWYPVRVWGVFWTGKHSSNFLQKEEFMKMKSHTHC